MHVRSVSAAWNASAARRAVTCIADRLGLPAYAVGGAVRDVLLGREPHDWDVATSDPERLARTVADELNGACVCLRERPMTCRVVVGVYNDHHPREEIDFSAYRGGRLEADLRARDFTVNSLAWRIGDTADRIVDPCGGQNDLAAGVIRATSPAVFASDPVRCLRTFRLSAELGFSIAPQTRAWLARYACLLAQSARERVGYELCRLARPPGLAERLVELDETGVLPVVLPEVTALRGIWQGGYHHLDVWGHTLEVIRQVETIAADPQEAFPASARLVERTLEQPAELLLLKIAALFHDLGKPAARTVVDGRVRFITHETIGARIARRVAGRLRMPRAVREALSSLVRWHMRPIMLITTEGPQPPSLSAVRRLLRDVAPHGVGLVVLAAADVLACRGPATSPAEQRERLRALDDMLARADEWEHRPQRPPLISGRDLIGELGLPPGPQFGVILEAVQRAQVDGQVQTREQALDLARRLAAEGSHGACRE